MSKKNRLTLFDLTDDPGTRLTTIAQNELAAQQQALGQSGRTTPLASTLTLVLSRGVKAAILQRDVQDPDFWAEHSSYYSKWPFAVPRFCTRLHLFTAPPASEDVLEAIDSYSSGDNSYLGFITFRPISSSPVGATILSAFQPGRYVTSRDSFPVNLAGHRFCIEGTPFLQQDNAVGACAQASIWMALRTLRRREGQAAYDPAQITSAATRFLVNGRTLPNRSGLSIGQITEAIRSSGFSPHIIPLRDEDLDIDNLEEKEKNNLYNRTKFKLYPYIESGIPVVLALRRKPKTPGHAVLLIGHGWNTDQRILRTFDDLEWGEKTVPLMDPSTWAEPFVIHNDNTGPYLELESYAEKGYCVLDAFAAIPFLPSDVFIDGSEARKASIALLKKALGTVEEKSSDRASEEDLSSGLVVRTFLIDRSDFRSYVAKSSMNLNLKQYYQLKWLPKRIWVTEINPAKNYNTAPNGSVSCYGEILIDPSAEPSDGPFLSIHLGPTLLGATKNSRGAVIDRDAFDGSIFGKVIENDVGYHIQSTTSASTKV